MKKKTWKFLCKISQKRGENQEVFWKKWLRQKSLAFLTKYNFTYFSKHFLFIFLYFPSKVWIKNKENKYIYLS